MKCHSNRSRKSDGSAAVSDSIATENVRAQGLNDRIDAYQRPLDHVPIERIPIQLLKPRIAEANRRR
jgi:hypothetical protein